MTLAHNVVEINDGNVTETSFHDQSPSCPHTSSLRESPESICTSAFHSFTLNSQGNSLLHFFNSLHDKIFKFKSITDSDIELLGQMLKNVSNDNRFNECLVKSFNPLMSTFDLKNNLQSTDPDDFSYISLQSAFNLLDDIYHDTSNDTIRRYIIYLTLSPIDLYHMADERFAQVGLSYTTFNNYLETYTEKFVQSLLRDNKLHRNSSGYSLLGLICQHDRSASLKMNKVKYVNVEVELDRCKSFQQIWSQMVQNYAAMNSKNNVAGFNFDGSFNKAVKLFGYLAPAWDKMNASTALRNKLIPQTNLSSYGMSGGSNYVDSDVVRIFAGSYDLINENEPTLNDVDIDLVTDYSTFNQLSSARKSQVLSFLTRNRKRFNSLLENATKVVINKLQHNSIANKLKSTSFAPRYVKNVGYHDNNDINDETMLFNSKLQSSLSRHNISSFSDAISFIVHDYIPMVHQFNNKCITKYGEFETKSTLNNYYNDNDLCVAGVGSQLELPTSTSQRVIQNIVPKQSPIFTPHLNGGSRKIHNVKTESNKVLSDSLNESSLMNIMEISSANNQLTQGGDNSGKSLVNAFIEGQLKFNNEYERIYRQLTNELTSVRITNMHEQSANKLYTLCSSIESIGIRNPLSTTYLSGYYGAKDYNSIYTKTVENVINFIRSNNLSEFNGVAKVLESLKSLLVATRKNMIDLRNKYINAPKKNAELFIVSVREIKQPCKLTDKDFIAFSDAISRIYVSIKNSSSESSHYNTDSVINTYISNIQDRSKIIKRHYEDEITAIRIMYASKSSNRDECIGRDIKISLKEQQRECMLYLNEVFEAKLTKERLQNIKNIAMTREQLQSIENAYVSFKNIMISPETKKLYTEIGKLLNKDTVISEVYKLIQKLKKLIISSNYFNLICHIHKELKIMNDFDWKTFIDKLSTLIAINSITISRKYSFGGNKEMSLDKYVHEKATDFEVFCQNQFNDKFKYVINSGYIFFSNLLHHMFKLNIVRNMKSMNSFEKSSSGNIKKIDEIVTSLKINGINNTDYANSFNLWTKFRFNQYNNIEITGNQIQITGTADKSLSDLLKSVDNICGDNALRFLLTSISCINEMIQAHMKDPNNGDYSFKDLVPYYIKHIPELIVAMMYAFTENKLSLDVSYTELNYHEFYIQQSFISDARIESKLVNYVLEALCTNILSVFDKYWEIRYDGVLNLPLNLAGMMKGGTKFDSKLLDDTEDSQIIPEAVPFYVSGINVCAYYIETFKPAENHDYTLSLKVNKISTLYPIYVLFEKQKTSIEMLTPKQMRIVVSVFNKLWNQTSGNPAQKLTRCIDLLFSELNASLLFGNKLIIDTFKTTGSFDNQIVDIMKTDVAKIIQSLRTACFNDNSKLTPELQSKFYEDYMKHAYNKVKDTPESQRYNALKSLFTDNNQHKDAYKDYYKFMELVVVPLMITANSYSEIFKLFDSYQANVDTSGVSTATTEINMNTILMNYPDVFDGSIANINKRFKTDTAWNMVMKITHDHQYQYKSIFAFHPVVLSWNRLLLQNSLIKLHKTGTYTLPNFWIVMDEHTYPVTPSIKLLDNSTLYMNDNIFILRQIFPEVHAKTIADYYNACISDFYVDFDQCVRNFISYPGISDKTIKAIEESVKSINKVQFDKTTQVITSNDTKINAMLDMLHRIRVEKIGSYVTPPSLPLSINIAPFIDGLDMYNELLISTDTVKCKVAIDGLSLYIGNHSDVNGINKCNYRWFDWVVFNLAKCDKINFCIPYKLLMMFKNNGELATYIRAVIPQKKSINKYVMNQDGTYECLTTQNIIGRSSTTTNLERSELSVLSPSHVAGLVSIIPYLINTLLSAKNHMESRVTYCGMNVGNEISNIIDILSMFFDEISNYTPFIPFLSDTNQLMSNKLKPKSFAELGAILIKNNISNMDVNDFIKLEWSNVHFFNQTPLTYPTYKNKDRFQWIKTYAEDKIEHSTFKNEFESTIGMLAKNMWRAIITKGLNTDSAFHNEYRIIDEAIVKSIHILSECDTQIIQTFVNNIVRFYNQNNNETSMNGSLMGGSITPNSTTLTNTQLAKDILHGIVSDFHDSTSVQEKAKLPYEWEINISPNSLLLNITVVNSIFDKEIDEQLDLLLTTDKCRLVNAPKYTYNNMVSLAKTFKVDSPLYNTNLLYNAVISTSKKILDSVSIETELDKLVLENQKLNDAIKGTYNKFNYTADVFSTGALKACKGRFTNANVSLTNNSKGKPIDLKNGRNSDISLSDFMQVEVKIHSFVTNILHPLMNHIHQLRLLSIELLNVEFNKYAKSLNTEFENKLYPITAITDLNTKCDDTSMLGSVNTQIGTLNTKTSVTVDEFIAALTKVITDLKEIERKYLQLLTCRMFLNLEFPFEIINYVDLKGYTTHTLTIDTSPDSLNAKLAVEVCILKYTAIYCFMGENGTNVVDDYKKYINQMNLLLLYIAHSTDTITKLYLNDDSVFDQTTPGKKSTGTTEHEKCLKSLMDNIKYENDKFIFDKTNLGDITAEIINSEYITELNGSVTKMKDALKKLYKTLPEYVKLTFSASDSVNELKFTKKYDALSMYGAAVTNINDEIFKLAYSVAFMLDSRASYIDYNINLETIPAVTRIDNNNALSEYYLYKYLYNPRLCTLFNRTGLSNTQFLNLIFGKSGKFIYQPLACQHITNNYTINIDRNTMNISNVDYLNGTGTEINCHGKLKNNNHMKTQHTLFTTGTNYEFTNKNSLINISYDASGIRITSMSPVDITCTCHAITPNPVHDCYEFNNILIKSTPHYINFDESMLSNMPQSNFVQQWLFSPQIDIYNCTWSQGCDQAITTIIVPLEKLSQSVSGTHASFIISYANIVPLHNDNKFVFDGGNTLIKSLSNYNELKSTSLHRFIEQLTDQNIDNIMCYNKHNVGLDVYIDDSVLKSPNNNPIAMLGSFFNINVNFNESNPDHLLSSIYTNDNKLLEAGSILYGNNIHSIGEVSEKPNYKIMFTYIMNYYHKYNISLDAIYSQLCFPSIIHNATLFEHYIKSIMSITEQLISQNNVSETVHNNTISFILSYFKYFSSNDHLGLEFIMNPVWHVGMEVISRNKYVTFSEIIQSLTSLTTTASDLSKYGPLWLVNQYSSPSVNNTFMNNYVNNITYITNKALHQSIMSKSQIVVKDSQNNCIYKNLYSLFGSDLSGTFRYVDTLTTILYSIFTLMKYTSYYSHTNENDVSYFNLDNPEALSSL